MELVLIKNYFYDCCKCKHSAQALGDVGLFCRIKEKDILSTQKKCKDYAEYTLTKKEFTLGVLKDELFCALCKFGCPDDRPGTGLHCAIKNERVSTRSIPCENYCDWRGPIKNE